MRFINKAGTQSTPLNYTNFINFILFDQHITYIYNPDISCIFFHTFIIHNLQ
jgi:hypothetical protein